jgi:hypothetical protein
MVLTASTGKYILSITDSAKTAFVPCCKVPGIHGGAVVGAALTTGNYG